MIKIQEIGQKLRAGEVVALPTETVYGLAVSLESRRGVKRLMALKERGVESGKVFTLVPEKVEDIAQYAVVDEWAERLIEKYLPGELTLVLKKNEAFRHFYFDNFASVGVRVPDFPIFTELLAWSGALLLTSANRRGEGVLGSLAEIAREFPEVEVVDTGMETLGRMPSTVVDCEARRILRAGRLAEEIGREL